MCRLVVERTAVLLLAVMALTVVVSAAGEPEVTITIPAEVTVSGSEVLLGEIGKIEGDEPKLVQALKKVSLGTAPIPGTTRTIPGGMVAVRLRQALIPLDKVSLDIPDTVEVEVEAKEISPAELAKKAEEALVDLLRDYSNAEWRTLTRLEPMVVPKGNVELLARTDSQEVKRRVSVRVDVFANGVFFRTQWISFTVSIPVKVVVLKETVSRHQPLTDDVLAVAERDLFSLGLGFFADPGRLLGYRSTRYALAGTVVTEGMIEPIPPVCTSDLVLLRSQFGKVAAAVQVEALGDGYLGDIVAFRNPSSGTMVYGVVTGLREAAAVSSR